MTIKKKPLITIGIVFFIVIVGYFIIDFYTDKQLVGQLPSVPNIENTIPSLKKQISTAFNDAVKNPSTENLGTLGMVFHANNFFDEAEKCYQLAIKSKPEAWKWSHYLGCLKRELGDSEGALYHFSNVLKSNPESYMALYYIGEAYQQMDSIVRAEQILKQVSKIKKSRFVLPNTKRTSYFPLSLYAKLQLAKLYANDEKPEEAENELKNLIKNQITFGPAYRQLSNLYALQGDKNLSKYYSNRSNDLNIYISPVDTLLDKLSLHSKSATYLLKQIDDAIRSSNSNWALELIELGLKNIPNNKYIISKAIKHYIDMNATKKALPYLDKHLKYFHNNYKEIIEVGVGLANRGYQSQAEKYFAIAEKFNDQSITSKATLAGMYYEKLGMKDKAITLIESLLNEHPNNPEVISAAIFLYLQNKDLVNAKKYLSKLKQIQPSHKDIYVFNGIIAQMNGNTISSINYFEKALKQNPEKKFIINTLRAYYNKNKQWNKALKLYETVLKHSPNDSDIQEAYGSLLLNCPDKSLRDLQQAKEFSERAFINIVYTLPTRIAAGRSLSIAYFELENYGKAIYYMDKTIKIAKRAGVSKSYIQELESILNDFRRIVVSSN